MCRYIFKKILVKDPMTPCLLSLPLEFTTFDRTSDREDYLDYNTALR